MSKKINLQECGITPEQFQRFQLLGVVMCILKDEGATVQQIKNAFINLLTKFIDLEALVGDELELLAMKAAKGYCLQTMGDELVTTAQNIINESTSGE